MTEPKQKKKPSPKPSPGASASKPVPRLQSNLAVESDGRALPETEAREIWTAFSVHMDTHEGDFDGFAKSRGYGSSRPEFRDGRAVLVIKR